MARILALDYGGKRTGVAVTDELQIIASGLTTVETKGLMGFLEVYLDENEVETIVVGHPKKLDNSENEIELEIKKAIKLIEKKHPTICIERVDERFTSKMAFATILESGIGKKKRRNKALVDQVSATIILQSYLSSKK
jgi:putative Holliday junction resolvase